ncbi:MAG TPA: Ig-like domain-containing protein, partial [Pyrinomonadaceae bacterium]|nr:Ig-like domain-containing protein [Pyrinomonadaceae bacterium]
MISPIVFSVNAQKVSGRAKQNNINMDLQNGLQFRLSEGVEGAENREKQPPAKGDPLSENDTKNLLKRIPEIKTQTDDQVDFAKRAGTLPAPKTGEKIPVKFPADEQRNAPNYDYSKQPLEVVRFSPEGEVKLAPDLTVTFSQPMVAVTSQEQASETVPVQLSPQVEGKWRWLGTKTLMFDTKKRFPQATKFTAKIPAGTKSATGQVLQKDFTWTFTTPPPKVETFVPANQITRRDVLMYLSFDQAVNPQEVIKFIKVSGGGKQIPIRLATQEEIDKDSGISYYSKQAQPNRWLAFRALNSDGLTENALPGASGISVVVDKGTPSAEGPLTTTAPQSFSFSTFSPFKFNGGYCGWRDNKNCSPFETWYLEFNNQIDAAKFAKEMVKIEPAVEGLNIYPSGNYIYFAGYKKGSTTYKVTVDGALQDIYGQTLGQNAVANIKVGKAEQNLYAQGGNMVVVDPTAKQNFSIFSTNHNSAKVRLYAVQPTDWKQFQEYLRRINYDDSTKKVTIPGRLVSDKVVQIAAKTDEMVETRIDLAEALNGGFGSVIVDIEPNVKRDKYDRTRIFTWVQSTQIGLDAFVDNDQLVGWATDLKTGKPLSGVDLAIYPNGKTVAENNPQSEIQNPKSSWWEWLTSWGTSEESIKEVQTVDESGETVEAETIEEAQTNRTGENGILRLSLPETSPTKPSMLIAKRGKDVAFLPENTDYYWQEGGTWVKQGNVDYLRWHIFDDRGMYRPKEEVAVKGYIRKVTAGKFGDVEGLGDSANNFTYKVYDSRNNEIGNGNGNLNAFGAFDFKFKLPDNANLGYARVEMSTNSKISGGTSSFGFQIQEFRRPEFEVKARNETEAPYFVKESAKVSVEAKYYVGGGLANADTNWVVRATPTNYTPPNRGDFTFGTFVPWWRYY